MKQKSQTNVIRRASDFDLKNMSRKSEKCANTDPKMRSPKVIFLMIFKGLGPRVPQGGPKDPPRAQKVTPKLSKVTPKAFKIGSQSNELSTKKNEENGFENLSGKLLD